MDRLIFIQTKIQLVLGAQPAGWALALLLSWYGDSRTLLMVMLIFVLTNLISGIWKTVKLKGWFYEDVSGNKHFAIDPKGIRRTIEKLLAFSSLIVLGLILDKEVFSTDWLSWHRIFAALICIAELGSISQNWTIVTKSKVFTKAFQLVKDLFNSKIKSNDTNEIDSIS